MIKKLYIKFRTFSSNQFSKNIIFKLGTSNNLDFKSLIWFLISLLGFFWLSQYFRIQSNGLDESWQHFLGFSTISNYQFSHKVVFTYGPAWYFLLHNYQPGLYIYFLLSSVFTSIIFGLFILDKPKKVITIIIMLYSFMVSPEAFYFLFILLLIYDIGKSKTLLIKPNLVIIWLAFISHSKFSYFILILPLLLLIDTGRLAERKSKFPRTLLLYIGAYVLAFFILGQNIQNILTYLKNGFDISSGYSKAMGLEKWDSSQFIFVLLIFYLGAVAEVIITVFKTNKKYLTQSLIICIGLLWFLFISFKAGYVRGHGLGFTILTISSVYLSFHSEDFTPYFRKFIILVLLLCIALANPYKNILNGVNLLHYLQSRPTVNTTLDSQYEKVKKNISEKAYIPVPKNETIDSYPFELAEVLTGGYNYYGRPIPQTYSAYTPYLQNLNYNHLINDGPDYILFKLWSLDNRFKTLMLGQSLTGLYLNYDLNNYFFTNEEPGIVLKRRKTQRVKNLSSHSELVCDVGIWLELPEQNSHFREAKIIFEPSVFGKLNTFLFRESQVNIEVITSNGKHKIFRFIPSVGSTPFILSPILISTSDVLNFEGAEKVVKIKISTEDSLFFNNNIKFSIQDFDITGENEIPLSCNAEMLSNVLSGELGFMKATKFIGPPDFFLFNSTSGLKQNYVSEIKLKDDGMHVLALNHDPSLIAPPYEVPISKVQYVKINLTVPENTSFQIFYITEESPNFDGEKLIEKNVYLGKNEIYIEINADSPITQIRFDPGRIKGKYIIHDFQIWDEKTK